MEIPEIDSEDLDKIHRSDVNSMTEEELRAYVHELEVDN